jgi:hypothetical protein
MTGLAMTWNLAFVFVLIHAAPLVAQRKLAGPLRVLELQPDYVRKVIDTV